MLIYKPAELVFASLAAQKLIVGETSTSPTAAGSLEQLTSAVEQDPQLKTAVGAPPSISDTPRDREAPQVSQLQFRRGCQDPVQLEVTSLVLGVQAKPYKVCIVQDQSASVELRKEKVSKQYLKSFFAMITHELRNPLNGVLGIFESLLESLVSEQRLQCQMGVSTVRLMMRLVNDILDMSQMDSDSFRLVEEDGDIVALVKDAVELMQFKYKTKGVGLHYQLAGCLPSRFRCDRNRFMQILLNILGNAIKFTEKGEVNIEVFYDPETRQLRTTVRDTGQGIKEEDRGRLFTYFGKLSDTCQMNPQGTGLGLYVCKKLSEAMGGGIELESVYRKGTTITFSVKNKLPDSPQGGHCAETIISLPTDKQAEEEGTPHGESTPHCCESTFSPLTGSPKPLSSATLIRPSTFSVQAKASRSAESSQAILVVDDEYICVRAVQSQLKSLGYESDSV